MLQKGRLQRFLVLCLVLASMSSVAVAQVAQTGIHGTVKDASSAVVPQAILELTDPSTNVVRKTTAGGDGSFVFVNLQDGSYKLTATRYEEHTSELQSL